MNTIKLLLIASISMILASCLGGNSTGVAVPGSPTAVKVVAGPYVGTTAWVSFTAPVSSGGSAITGYTVTTSPGNITATGTSSPITLTGLTAGTNYTFSVTANNNGGISVAATTTNVKSYNVTETFEQVTYNASSASAAICNGKCNTVFTGSFTLDSISGTVSNLTGSLTQAMKLKTYYSNVAAGGASAVAAVLPTPVQLNYQLSSVPDNNGGVLVTTFLNNTTDTFSNSGGVTGVTGWALGGKTILANQNANAYATIDVNLTNPTMTYTTLQMGQAYADCTTGSLMMGTTCMTGYITTTGTAGGTMSGTLPITETIVEATVP